MCGDELRGAAFAKAGGQFGARPAFRRWEREVAAHHPDNVGQILEALADEAAVLPQGCRSCRLDLFEESLISAIPTKIGGAQPDSETASIRLGDGRMGV